MQNCDALVIKRESSEETFSPERFSARMSELFPKASAAEAWIRSGMHIPAVLKDTISSYRLISRHRTAEGHGKADCLQIKLAPGAELLRSEKKCLNFILSYMKKESADAALLAIVPAGGGGSISLFALSPARRGVVIPQEILEMMTVEGIKNYLMKACRISPAALGGYFSDDAILFDDTPIAKAAKEIDAALDAMLFCDIASGCGEIAVTAAKKVAAARAGLNKYLPQRQNSDEDFFLRRFIESSLFATDCSEAAVDILKARLKALCPGAKLPEERFAWGSVLVDGIFDDVKFDLIISNPPHLRAAKSVDASLELKAPPASLFDEEEAQDKEERGRPAARILENTAQQLVQKLMEENAPLSRSGFGRVYRGILTGLNEAFVLDAEKAREISEREPASAELIVPFYSGRDVKRYYLPQEKRYLIFMPKGFTDGMSGFSDGYVWLAKNHPLLATHLARYEAKAAARRDRGDYWWELRPCGYYDVFRNKKIILPIICRNISAAADRRGVYANDKCCVIEGGDPFLIALLNSSLLDFVFRMISPALLNDYCELRPSILEKLPIATPKSAKAKEAASRIAEMGEKLSALYEENPPAKYGSPPEEIRNAEREANRLVYSLYGLTPKEIAVVENN